MKTKLASYLSGGACLLVALLLMPQVIFAGGGPTTAPLIIEATVTAYTSSSSSVTASGRHTVDGIVACPRRYPFGTKFKIDGKIYECQDRTNRKYGDRFDIWKPSWLAARTFGRRRLAVVLVSSPASHAEQQEARADYTVPVDRCLDQVVKTRSSICSRRPA
jgi:3D (Asp-Asp-Asp) domain-containing protein